MDGPIDELKKLVEEGWADLEKRHQELLKSETTLDSLSKKLKKNAAGKNHEAYIAVKKQMDEAKAKREQLYEERMRLVEAGCVYTVRVTGFFSSRQQVIDDYKQKLQAVWIDGPGGHDCKLVNPWHMPAGFLPTPNDGEYNYMFCDPKGSFMKPLTIPAMIVPFIDRSGVID